MKEFAGFTVTDKGLLDAEGNEVPRYRWVFVLRTLKEEVKEFEEWFLEVCRASEYLNLVNARVEVSGGKITALEFHPDEDYDNPCEPTPAQYNRLGLGPDDLGCIDDHPEGSDRGGYVPTLSNGCFFMENSGEWQGG